MFTKILLNNRILWKSSWLFRLLGDTTVNWKDRGSGAGDRPGFESQSLNVFKSYPYPKAG